MSDQLYALCWALVCTWVVLVLCVHAPDVALRSLAALRRGVWGEP